MRSSICPLCNSNAISDYEQDKLRDYYKCDTCQLIFVPESQHLNPETEKSRYDYHQNNPDDPGYRDFLGRLFNPLVKMLTPGSKGLDFGSGPGPTLSVMFEEKGFSMDIYDCFYSPNADVLQNKYDFITATEVFEHLRKPDLELTSLWKCLKPDGVLGIMTQLVTDELTFKNWHYKNDDTHICFYSRNTFNWIAENWLAEIEYFDNNVIILHKKN